MTRSHRFRATLPLLATLATIAALPVLARAATDDAPRTPAEASFADKRADGLNDPVRRALPHVGLLGGVSDIPGDQAGGLVGVDVGYQPVSPISLGANFSVAGPTQNESRMMLLGKAAYNLGGDLPVIRYSYIGGQAGWVRDSIEITDALTFSEDYFAIGPTVGFDQPVASEWTLGAEARYLMNFTDVADNTFAAAAMVKYWF